MHSETAKLACHFAVAKATANSAVPVICDVSALGEISVSEETRGRGEGTNGQHLR